MSQDLTDGAKPSLALLLKLANF